MNWGCRWTNSARPTPRCSVAVTIRIPPAPDAADGLGEASHDELVLQGLFAAERQLKEPAPHASETNDSESDVGTADERRPSTPSPIPAPSGPTGLRPGSRSAAAVPDPSGATHPWTRARTDRCEISPRTILEAMLFVGHPANEPLTAKQVASLMRGVLPREIDELVRELNDAYAAEGTPYRIESDGAGYRLTLRARVRGTARQVPGTSARGAVARHGGRCAGDHRLQPADRPGRDRPTAQQTERRDPESTGPPRLVAS